MFDTVFCIITHFLTLVNRQNAKILLNIDKTRCRMNLLLFWIALFLKNLLTFGGILITIYSR